MNNKNENIIKVKLFNLWVDEVDDPTSKKSFVVHQKSMICCLQILGCSKLQNELAKNSTSIC